MNTKRLSFVHQPLFWWILFLLCVMAAGAYAAFIVFTQGLSVTNLTDLVPWGLWISIDLSSIALSAGAFLLSAAVYLLGIKKLQPVARTAVFVGLIGYSMACLCLLLDIPRETAPVGSSRRARQTENLKFWDVQKKARV